METFIYEAKLLHIMTWKNNVDPIIKSHLERQIAESIKHKNAFNESDSPAKAQLWVAIANLSKELFDINLKLNYLERALKQIAPKSFLKKQKTRKAKKSTNKEVTFS